MNTWLLDVTGQVVLEPFYRHCLGIGTSVQRVAVAQLLQANLADLAVPDRAQAGAGVAFSGVSTLSPAAD